MNSQWKAFLETQSARISGSDEIRFEDAPPFPDCALFDLSHLGLIGVQGADALDFLQGQFTNDTRNITEERSQMSGYCNPKGRMLAAFRIFRRADTIYLQLPMSLLEPLLKRLSMFVLRASATLKNASDELVRIGLAGDCAESALAGHLPHLPQVDDDAVQHGGLTAIRVAGSQPRFEIVGPVTEMQELWQALATRTTPANPDFWAWLDIHAGIPTVYPETTEAFVPQMANMQLVNGVSFTKGCYTGQEVVARMRYLGKLKRRMYLAHIDSDTAPRPGAALFSASSESGQGTGKVVAAQTSPGGGCDLLAVVQISAVEEGDVRVGDNGPRLEFRELPYDFVIEDNEQET